MKKFIIILFLLISILLLFQFPIIYTYLTLLYILIISIIAFLYKPYNNNFIGSCDIIIPVFNEGQHIFKTIKSINQSNYKNFNIIIIDDGSTDDTKKWIQKSCLLYNNIKAIYCNKNRGKKYVLADGIKNSKADIIITIDSDSIISKNAIQNILKPFTISSVGAVAGNIEVNNINNGIIPKLMDIIFIFSYQIIKSSQSMFKSVLCTPGALSAYRRIAILPILDIWLQQKFLGKDTIIGEDRALTSLLIKNNWDIIYQQTAIAYTNVPITYNTLCKMLLRWVRGDIRENIFLFNYVFNNISFKNIKSIGLFFHYLVFNIGILFPIMILPIIIIYYCINFQYFLVVLPYLILSLFTLAIIPMLIYIRKKSFKYSPLALIYSLFSLIFLSWIPFFAIITVTNNNWLTRK